MKCCSDINYCYSHTIVYMPLATEKRSATIKTFSTYLQQQMLTGKSLGESFYNAEAMLRIAISEYWKHPLTRLISDLNAVLKVENISLDYLTSGQLILELKNWMLKTSYDQAESRFDYCSDNWKRPLIFLISLLFLKVENILWPGWLSDLNETWDILKSSTQISGL